MTTRGQRDSTDMIRTVLFPAIGIIVGASVPWLLMFLFAPHTDLEWATVFALIGVVTS